MDNQEFHTSADHSAPVADLSYEQAYYELESIVSALEQDNQSLESAMALFERGQVLARRCADLLDQAEMKIQQISGGELVDFTPES